MVQVSSQPLENELNIYLGFFAFKESIMGNSPSPRWPRVRRLSLDIFGVAGHQSKDISSANSCTNSLHILRVSQDHCTAWPFRRRATFGPRSRPGWRAGRE